MKGPDPLMVVILDVFDLLEVVVVLIEVLDIFQNLLPGLLVFEGGQV